MAKTVKLQSSDGIELNADEAAMVKASTVIRHMIQDVPNTNSIPVQLVDGRILAKVIAYCEKHHASAAPAVAGLRKGGPSTSAADKELRQWDAEFLNVDLHTLRRLINAANFLEIQGLLDLLCQAVANIINGKSTEEIRKVFGIENDFMPEEEAAIQAEFAWAFDGRNTSQRPKRR